MKPRHSIAAFFLLGAALAGAQTTFNGTTGSIPDNQCPAFTEFTANVSGLPGSGAKVEAVAVNISHSFDGDLSLFLESPGGIFLELCTGNGGGGDNFTNTVFSDAGAGFVTAGSAPYTGTFKPEGRADALGCNPAGTLGTFTLDSQFGGSNPNGTWTLHVSDDAGGDTGSVTSWSLTISSALPDDVAVESLALAPGCFSGAQSVPVTLRNAGTNPIPAGAVSVAVAGGENAPPPVAANAAPIAPGATAVVSVPGVDLPTDGKRYTLTAAATYAPDSAPENNSASLATQNLCNVTAFAGAGGTLTRDNCDDPPDAFPAAVSGLAGLLGCELKIDRVTIDVTTPTPHELNFFLRSPDGRVLDLFTRGRPGANFTGTTFTDDAPRGIENFSHRRTIRPTPASSSPRGSPGRSNAIPPAHRTPSPLPMRSPEPIRMAPGNCSPTMNSPAPNPAASRRGRSPSPPPMAPRARRPMPPPSISARPAAPA
ncbi:MAG: proprotein convertase P-domain-containing protein [Verrucomicrobiales bacterium]